jgi:hypothetical protein
VPLKPGPRGGRMLNNLSIRIKHHLLPPPLLSSRLFPEGLRTIKWTRGLCRRLGSGRFLEAAKQVKSSHSTFLFSQTANMSKTRNSGLIIHRTSRTSFVFPESDAPHPPDTQQNSENTKIISSLWAPATVSQREGEEAEGRTNKRWW